MGADLAEGNGLGALGDVTAKKNAVCIHLNVRGADPPCIKIL